MDKQVKAVAEQILGGNTKDDNNLLFHNNNKKMSVD